MFFYFPGESSKPVVPEPVVWNTMDKLLPRRYLLTLYTLTSVYLFSILFSKYFLRFWYENLLNNQELREFIISFILVTLLFDLGLIL